MPELLFAHLGLGLLLFGLGWSMVYRRAYRARDWLREKIEEIAEEAGRD